MIAIREVIEFMQELAPPSLAEDWDNVGLQIGRPETGIDRIVVTLDPSHEAIAQAGVGNSGLLVCHHPLILDRVSAIRTDQSPGSLIEAAIKKSVGLYVAHTNLDNAPDGVSAALAGKLGLIDHRPLRSCAVSEDRANTVRYFKLVVFVPADHEDKVRDAISRAGAGHIGRYSDCTFSTGGTGTFRPLEGTNPFIGTTGELEKVDEHRLETIVPESLLDSVLEAMLDAHPYEEVAYDVYRLSNVQTGAGLGRIGSIPSPVSLREFALVVAEALGCEGIKAGGNPERKVRKVVVIGGSGAKLWREAVRAGADVLVTGDIGYHQYLEANSAGLALIDAGHDATEWPGVVRLAEKLKHKFERQECVQVMLFRAGTGPYWSLCLNDRGSGAMR